VGYDPAHMVLEFFHMVIRTCVSVGNGEAIEFSSGRIPPTEKQLRDQGCRARLPLTS
jgi:hypothetical protein